MAGVAPHVDALIATRLNFLQTIVDGSQHAEHFAGAVLIRIFVRGKIKCAERFAFLSLVAVRATDSQCSREASHHGLQARPRPIFRQHLKVLWFFGPRPALLCPGSWCEENYQ